MTYGQILLVGEDKEDGIPQLVLVEHALQLLTGLDDTVTIVAVDDEDDTLGVLEVMSPQRSDLVLTTDIPHGELDVLVLDRLDVETCDGRGKGQRDGRSRSNGRRAGRLRHTNGRDGRDDFTELELVEDGGLSGGVQTDHQNSHLLLPPQLVEYLGDRETHDCDEECGARLEWRYYSIKRASSNAWWGGG